MEKIINYIIVGLIVSILSMVSMDIYTDYKLEKLNNAWSEFHNETVNEMNIEYNELWAKLNTSHNNLRNCIEDYNNITNELYEAQIYNNELWNKVYIRKNLTWTGCSNPDINIPSDNYIVNCSKADSMLPTFGCEHKLKMCSSYDSLNVGDIILFNNGQSHVIHRIVGINYNGFLTKGDNNPSNDFFVVFEENIIAKLSSIST